MHKIYLSNHNSLTLELVCSVESNPTSSPAWVYLDEFGAERNISTDSKKSNWVVERGEGRDMVSVVIIHSPRDQHLGEYVCHAGNSLGQARQSIRLTGKFNNVRDVIPHPRMCSKTWQRCS